MKSFDFFDNIYFYSEPVDFRMGAQKLFSFAENELLEVYKKSLFVFRGRSRNKIKMIYWDGTGIAMWQKILSEDKFFWPKSENLKIDITKEEIDLLLKGVNLSKVNFHKYKTYDN